jgi:hypothetical protein
MSVLSVSTLLTTRSTLNVVLPKWQSCSNDSNEAVCDYRNINSYPHSVLCIAPEGRDAKMLLYPPKKQFHLPALLVQHSDVFRLDADVISQEGERSFKVGSIINYPPQYAWIFLLDLIV